MPEVQTLFDDMAQAEAYVENAREHYREGHVPYKGARSEAQSEIAELSSDEARMIVDGVAAGFLALLSGGTVELPTDYETNVNIAGYKWSDFRGEFERLLGGFGVFTSRLERDGYGTPSYADLSGPDRNKVSSILFSDFLAHNALRFGVDSAGTLKTDVKFSHTLDGGIERTTKIFDQDKAQSPHEIAFNMRNRGYTTETGAHPAVKMSPDDYKKLRKSFPDENKDRFDFIVGNATNARETIENQGA